GGDRLHVLAPGSRVEEPRVPPVPRQDQSQRHADREDDRLEPSPSRPAPFATRRNQDEPHGLLRNRRQPSPTEPNSTVREAGSLPNASKTSKEVGRSSAALAHERTWRRGCAAGASAQPLARHRSASRSTATASRIATPITILPYSLPSGSRAKPSGKD